jgi:hypothetical protein
MIVREKTNETNIDIKATYSVLISKEIQEKIFSESKFMHNSNLFADDNIRWIPML